MYNVMMMMRAQFVTLQTRFYWTMHGLDPTRNTRSRGFLSPLDMYFAPRIFFFFLLTYHRARLLFAAGCARNSLLQHALSLCAKRNVFKTLFV